MAAAFSWKKIPREEESKPFLDHLQDFRTCIVQVIVALGVGLAIATPLAPHIMELITRPLEVAAGSAGPYLRSLDVTGAFSLWMRLSLWAGLVFSLPGILYAVGLFVLPGLTSTEKRVLRQMGGMSLVLFAVGVYLGYRALPMALKAMMAIHAWMHLRAEWTITSYVPFAMQVILAFGLVFQMPIILLLLGRLGLVRASFLREKRRHMYVIIFIIAAVLTPPEVISQIIMASVLIVLYEACVVLMGLRERDAKNERH